MPKKKAAAAVNMDDMFGGERVEVVKEVIPDGPPRWVVYWRKILTIQDPDQRHLLAVRIFAYFVCMCILVHVCVSERMYMRVYVCVSVYVSVSMCMCIACM